MKDTFFRVLKEHAARYPQMEIQDYGKLAFQSEYGPKHLATEMQSVLAFLKEEMAELPSDTVPGSIEPIGGGLCRFPLSFCKSEEELKVLAELFLLTAKEDYGSAEGIRGKTEELQKLHIPGMTEWLEDWKKQGYPPVHHSRCYRETYHPHYRLLKREYAGCFSAITAIAGLMDKKEPVIIGIDGRCGSGKTGFANLLGRIFDCNIFHMDDFYLPAGGRAGNWKEIPGGNIDFNRLLWEVLEPVQNKRAVTYRPYDCQRGQITKAIRMIPRRLNVIEGSYSQHPALREAYQLKIFLTCSKEEQERRLRIREGSYFSVFEEQWIPFEEHYYQCYNTDKSSDLYIDTSDFFV